MNVTRCPLHRSARLLRSGFLIVLTLAGFAAGAEAGSAAPALTKSLEIKSQGITIQYPDGWTHGPGRFLNAYELNREPAAGQLASQAGQQPRLLITMEESRDHAAAIRRLNDIALEAPSAPHTFLSIGGWPGVQRRQTLKVEQPDSLKAPETSETYERFTTAVAVGATVVRVEGFVPSTTPSLQSIAEEILAIGKGLVCTASGDPAQVEIEIDAMKARHQSKLETMSSGVSVALNTAASAGVVTGLLGDPELNIRVNNSTSHDSEIEVAVSTNGRNIVVGNNSRDWSFSNDGGRTWTFGGSLAQPAGFFAVNGDPSLAFGRSGAFYFAFIGYPDTDASAARDECSTAIDASTNGGQTFAFRGNAVYCQDGGGACFPDQEHIAADRFNAAAGGGDQVYSVWRHFTGGSCANSGAGPVASIVCSNDGGQNWTGVATIDGGGDRPRIAVGQDGAVHVVYRAGANIMYRRYSSCTTGLVPAGAAVPVAGGIPGDGSSCPLPGIDRCSSPFLSSQTVAVDDNDPGHIYVAYALTTTANTNEEIRVQDSIDGGGSFPAARTATVSNGVVTRRYMPWVCSVGGAAYVGWYDRRNATAADNSLTDYFIGSAALDSGGDLVPGTEFKISRVSDSACASGWITDGSGGNQNCVPRTTNDSESCTAQPQLAGRCCQVALNGNNCPAGMGSGNACDFSDGGCPAGESCQTGNGCPKYGDYSGITCGAGRFYAAWASAISPPTIAPASGNIDVFIDQKLVCCVPQIQVPGSVTLSDTCVGSSSTASLQVCNTGKEDLEVDSIGSNNTQFAVTTPSSGFPVVISPDFCFPFEVRFTPTSTGAKSAILTITSNDTVSPSVQVTANGSGLQQRLVTQIADSGSFGDVCRGDHKDLPLTLSNSGGCSLSVSSITSSSAEFQVGTTLTPPIVIGAGDSLETQVRLAPTTLGAKAANITINSDDPASPKVVPVTGNTPPGDVRVTGSTSFGDVCAGVLAEKTVSVCNVGKCDLAVLSAAFSPACADFTLVNNPFPATVSHDSCNDLVIRFTPTSIGPKSCTLVITTDDPDTPTVSLSVTGNTPTPMIDVPPDQSFPATVIQSIGSCTSGQPFPVSNTGTCPLYITNMAITVNPAEFSQSGLPSFPIILEPGHIAGEGDLNNVFAPGVLDRDRLGSVQVTYTSDPILGTTTSITRALCGEGTRTGARVLVTAGGVPLAQVEKIQLQRINANRNKNILDTNDVARKVALQTVTPASPCAPFQFHREYSTVGNPIQLLPGAYQVTATAIVNGKRMNKTVGFNLDTCGFNANIVINF